MLNGRPALEWTILAVQEAFMFDRIVVSTDSEEVAACAAAVGAEVPFVRPAALASDEAAIRDVVRHAVDEVAPRLSDTSDVALVYATAVLLDPMDLHQSHMYWKDNLQYNSCLSVSTFPHPIDRAMFMADDGHLELLDEQAADVRTQDVVPRVHDAAQFCWSTAAQWRSTASMLKCALGYPIPSWRAVDIDNEEDWTMAELLHTALGIQRLPEAYRSRQ